MSAALLGNQAQHLLTPFGDLWMIHNDFSKFLSLTILLLPLVAHGAVEFSNPGPGGGSDLWTLELHPTDADTFLLGGDIEGPFKTTDGGQTYRRVSSGIADTAAATAAYASQDFAYDPQNPNVVFLAGWGGVYKSTDAAESWVMVLPDPPILGEAGESFSAVAVSPDNSNLVLAGNGNPFSNGDGASVIHRSTDGGSSWSSIDLSGVFTGSEVAFHTILFDTVTSGVVYAATGEGVIKSSDNGVTWSLVNSGLPTASDNSRPISNHLVGVTNNGSFLLFTALLNNGDSSFNAGGIYRSSDAAATWENITGDLPTMGEESNLPYSYWRVTVDPFDPNNIIVGTRREWAWDQMGIYRTNNGLASDTSSISWTWLWDPDEFNTRIVDWGWLDDTWWLDQHVHFLAYSPVTQNLVITGSDNVYRSEDGGDSWDQAYLTNNNDGTYTTTGLELMVTYDVTVDPSDGNTIWVGNDDMGLFKSIDGGTSFRRMDATQNPSDLNETDCACQVVVDHTDSNTLYVGRHGGDEELNRNWSRGFIYKSTDAGANWSQVGTGQVDGGRTFLSMLRGGTSTTRTLLATVYGKGIYRSTDSGTTWSTVNGGIDSSDLTKLWSLAEGVGDVIYLGSGDMSPEGDGFEGSIYRSSDGGMNWQKLSGDTVPSGQVKYLDVGSDGVVYAATTSNSGYLQTGSGTNQGGLYRSADDGVTWSRVIAQPRVDGVSVRKDDPTQVVAAVSSYWNQLDDGTHDLVAPGIYLSSDSGLNFTRETNGLTHTFYWFIKYDEVNTNQFYAGTRGGGYFKGVTSSSDTDSDGDGVNDSVDAFPNNADESVDTDNDGIGNNADTDDDGDGLSDELELSIGFDPLDSNDATGSPREILWRHATSGQNVLWSMESQHRVERNSINTVADANWQVEGMGDFMGDGTHEIFFRHQTRGENRLWTIVNGARESSLGVMAASTEWSITSIGDFDADGDADLMWRNTNNGNNRFWEMNGTTRLRSVAVRSVSLSWSVAGSGDFDGDGRHDLLWRNTNGSNVIWLMQAETRSERGALPTVGGTWEVAGIGDFDGDGMDDMFWHNPESGANSIWLLNGAERKSRGSIPGTPAGWAPFSVFDMNGDGKADILWRNSNDGSNRLWLMNGTTRTSSVAVRPVSDQNWVPVAVGNIRE